MEENKEPGSELNELTEKQKRFCEEYIFDWNGARAARAAGYSEDTAKEIAYENLTKPHIAAYIEELKAKTAELAGVSLLRVSKEYAKLAFTDAADLRTDWNEVKEWSNLTEAERALIAGVTTTKRTMASGDERVEIEETKLEYKTHDKHRALEALRKMFGYDASDSAADKPLNVNINWYLPKPKDLDE